METESIVLHRLRDTGKSTLGVLSVTNMDLAWASLEPSDFFNLRHVSCIPTGEYIIKHYTSPRFGKCLVITGVPERDYILIHAGNFWDDTEGCVIPGTWFAQLDGDGALDVKESKTALAEIMALVPANGCPFIVQKDKQFQSIYR